MNFLHQRGYFKGPYGRRYEMVTNLGLIGSALLLCLPPAIATFPQTGRMKVSSLEENLQNVKDPTTGKVLEYVEFNKGL